MLTLLSRLEPELNAVLGALLSKFTTPEKAIHMELVMDMMQTSKCIRLYIKHCGKSI